MQNVINYTVNRYNCQGKAALFDISDILFFVGSLLK